MIEHLINIDKVRGSQTFHISPHFTKCVDFGNIPQHTN